MSLHPSKENRHRIKSDRKLQLPVPTLPLFLPKTNYPNSSLGTLDGIESSNPSFEERKIKRREKYRKERWQDKDQHSHINSTKDQSNPIHHVPNVRRSLDEEFSKEAKNEKKELFAEIEHLKKLNQELKDRLAIHDSGCHLNSINDETKSQLENDCEMLKSLVRRLNAQLHRYQEKLHRLTGNKFIEEDKLVADVKGIKLNRIRELKPLLLAYDELLAERQDVVNQYHSELGSLSVRVKDVVKENQHLHQSLEELKQESEKLQSESESCRYQENILNEEKKILTEQLEISRIKIEELTGTFTKKVEEKEMKLEVLQDRYNEARGALLVLQGHYTNMKQEVTKLRADTQEHVPKSLHVSAVEECRRLFEDLKLRYENDKKAMTDTIARLENERTENLSKIASLNSDIKHYEEQKKIIETDLKKCKDLSETLKVKKANLQASRDSTRRELQRIMKFTTELVEEQELLVKRLHEKEIESAELLKIGSAIGQRAEQLRSRLRSVEQDVKLEMDSLSNKLQRQQEEEEIRLSRDSRELQRLRLLLKNKDELIEQLRTDKNKLQEDLQIAWKTNSYPNEKSQFKLNNKQIHS